MKGSFIVFEGIDHCGKTTQIDLLKEYFYDHKKSDVVFTREPGGASLDWRSNIGAEIRKILLDPYNNICDETEAYLHAAARAQHTEFILYNIAKEKMIVCDRHYYSSVAYQGYGRKLGAKNIRLMNAMAIKNLFPDLVFYFRLELDDYLKRRNKEKELDRMEQQSLEFFKDVLNGYDEIFINEETALTLSDRLIIIDATQSIETIHEQVIEALLKRELL